MAVKISYVDSYKSYGKCMKMENDLAELLVTVDVGPRIIYFGAKGGVNMLFNDDEGIRVTNNPVYKSIFGEDAEYHFYGGHRIWLAPQKTFYTESPDNEPLKVELLENGASFESPDAKVIGFIQKLTVIMDPDAPTITVTAEVTNTSDEPKQNAVWQITQCAAGGVGFYPYMKIMKMPPMKPGERPKMPPMDPEKLKNPLLPMGNLVTFMGAPDDDRLIVDPEYITMSFSTEARRPIKFGMQNQQNFAMYANGDYILKFGYSNDPYGVYCDYGCSLESYTDRSFTEMEALGEYKVYGKGETISHTETISVEKLKAPIPDLTDREAVKAFVELHR